MSDHARWFVDLPFPGPDVRVRTEVNSKGEVDYRIWLLIDAPHPTLKSANIAGERLSRQVSELMTMAAAAADELECECDEG